MTTESTPNEKTHTVTLTENELARIIGALEESADALAQTSAERGGSESEGGAYPAMLATAARDLRTRLCAVLQPPQDEFGFITSDERIRREGLVDL